VSWIGLFPVGPNTIIEMSGFIALLSIYGMLISRKLTFSRQGETIWKIKK